MIVGILLAAGASRRFGGDKLLADLGNGQCVAELACARLLPSVDRLISIVRPNAGDLAVRLAAAGAEVCVFANAHQGMGASLAYGIGQVPDAAGWLIALADMPMVASADALRIANSLRAGATIAVPVSNGRRGHPVGFAQQHFGELTALEGDQGARNLLTRHAATLTEIPLDDACTWTWCDVDTGSDLEVVRRILEIRG
jgi:molybdenum cofactor cytidylyltransferase